MQLGQNAMLGNEKDSEYNIAEAARTVGRIVVNFVAAIDDSLRAAGLTQEQIDTLIEQEEQSRRERSAVLEAQHDKSRKQLRRNWKRY